MADSEWDGSSGMASSAGSEKGKSSQTDSIAVTGQEESSLIDTTDTSGGSAAVAATSGGSTAVTSGNRESSVTVSSTATQQAESALLGATTTQGAEVSASASGDFVVVYAAQTHHKAILIKGVLQTGESVQEQEGQSEWVWGYQLRVQTPAVHPSNVGL
ncbi:hypothetical protein IRJ41_023633, partial [Triplophysa rosa]